MKTILDPRLSMLIYPMTICNDAIILCKNRFNDWKPVISKSLTGSLILHCAGIFRLINCQFTHTYTTCSDSKSISLNSSHTTITYKPSLTNEECEWTFELPNHQNEFMLEIEIKTIFATKSGGFIKVELPNDGKFVMIYAIIPVFF